MGKTASIKTEDLLRYNGMDCMATWYAYEKYKPLMIADEQEAFYTEQFKPTVKTLLATEICGMPINPIKVKEAKDQLTKLVDGYILYFQQSKLIQTFHREQLVAKAISKTEEAAAKAKTDRATKIYQITDSVIAEDFNPGSDTQLRKLIYEYLGYSVIDLTKGKQPATGAKTLKKLINHTTDPEHIEIFETLIALGDASIILSTFIPAFENAQQLPDGSYRLFGCFNLGGTKSTRLSSSNPNLQNIPSSSTYAKLVKACFEPIGPHTLPTGERHPGWLYVGSDMDSLEDKMSALLTRDENKLKVYTDGYDGHSLRAYSYWGNEMPLITSDTPEMINKVAELYKSYRQKSKAPTFALTYMGTFKTLMNNCGFTEEEAKSVEANYHALYKESDAHMEAVIETAKTTGYVPLIFGARIRTPLLAQTVGVGRAVPYAAIEESRSAGNAYTQSYCWLTIRAFNEFMLRVWESEYWDKILPCATIHDAIYLLCIDNAEVVWWVNKNLIECMSWQELDELKHPTIKISSGLEIYWPSWKDAISIPNKVSVDELKQICKIAELNQKQKEEINP